MSKIKALKKESQVALPNSGETYIAEDGTVSMVLDDTHDEYYEPSEQEVTEYAVWLGMTLPEDKELIWIAKEGLRAPLPKEWKPCKTDTGEVYYFNFKTGDSIWDHPMDEHFKSKFKTEKERLRKAKENGGKVEDVLSKLPQRTNTVFSQQGVLIQDGKPPNSVPEKAADVKPLTQVNTKNNAKASTLSSPMNSTSMAASSTAPGTKTFSPAVKDEPLTLPMSRAGASKAASSSASSSSMMESTSLSHTTYSAPAPAPEPTKLVSEAEKMLQDRIRQEVESEHKQLVEKLEKDFTDSTSSQRQTHEQTVAELRRQQSQSKRSQVAKIENDLQDEMESQQKGMESRSKRDIQRVEEDIDRVRDKIRELQSTALTRLEKESEEIDKSVREGVTSKVREIEEEIHSIRSRHAKGQDESIQQKISSLEIEEQRALVIAKETIASDFDIKSNEIRQQHSLKVKMLRDEANQAMVDEARRADLARNGQQDTVVQELRNRQREECASILAESSAAQQNSIQEEEARLQNYKHQLSSELALVVRQGSQAATSPAVAAVDAEMEAQLRRAVDDLDNDRRRQMDELAAERARQRATAAAQSSGTSFSSDVEGLTARLERTNAAEERSAQERLLVEADELQASLARELRSHQEGSRAKALQDAVERDFQMFVSATMESRRSEERAFETSRQDILAHNARIDEEQQRANAAASSSRPPPAQRAPPAAQPSNSVITRTEHVPATAAQIEQAAASQLRDSADRLKRTIDDEFAAACRKLRDDASNERSRLTLELADVLANLEQQERRKIDVELQQSAPQEADAAPHNSNVSDMQREQRREQNHAALQRALADVDREFDTQLARLRATYQQRMSTVPERSARPHSTSDVALPLQQQQRSSTPPQSIRHPGTNSAPLTQNEAMRFLDDQQRELARRQEALAHARGEYNDGVQTHKGGGVSGEVHQRHQQEANEIRNDVASLHAIRKYYEVQQGAAPRYADPASVGDATPQLVLVLSKLNEKLDALSAKVSALEPSADVHPRVSSRQHRGPSPVKINKHRSDAAFDDKWNGILGQLNSKGKKTHGYADAVRQYCSMD